MRCWTECLAILLVMFACGESPDAGAAQVPEPGPLQAAPGIADWPRVEPPDWPTQRHEGETFTIELPVGARGNVEEGPDFVVTRFELDGRHLGGVYEGNFASFPIFEATPEDQIVRDEAGRITCSSLMRGPVLLGREWLLEADTDPPAAGMPPPPPEWGMEMHVWTRRDEAGLDPVSLRTMATVRRR